jgi:hypothetical protein
VLKRPVALIQESAGRVSHANPGQSSSQPWPRIAKETHSSGLLAVLANQTEKESIHVEKQDGNTAHNRFTMLISAGMTWQQRLLFIGGIAFGVVVEALPSLVDELKERVAEWRRFRQFSVKAKAA